jgi:hypothetical protein
MTPATAPAFDLAGGSYSDSLAQAFVRFLLWHLTASSNIKPLIYGICGVRSTPWRANLPKNEKKRLLARVLGHLAIYTFLAKLPQYRLSFRYWASLFATDLIEYLLPLATPKD